MAHGNPVIYADCIEFKRNAAGFADRFLDDFAELLKMYMSRYDVDVRVTDRNERFAEILFLYACGTQETAVRCTVEAFLIMSERIFLAAIITFPPEIC